MITYLLQEVSITYAGTLWIIVDTINFGLLANLNVILKILSHRIELLGWNNIKTMSKNENDRYNYTKICDSIKYHSEITR